ncbi:vWA domain-containing protein [Nonomuraea endophytica]|uniref:VWFA domain-containing protein n=1 Tax=Nonomuraea endophytica TaxID=714136 RepID=A0A7W8ELW8_9ACTN|nr:vWA domain-containing protein [Nonomuraea endophytica]MBB5083828.1 hypothetical protein [Nonomuraea endophytica]
MRVHMFVVITAVLLLVSPVALAGTGPAEPPQAGRSEVYQSLGVFTGADYVVVLDASGSMDARRTEVIVALNALLSGIKPVDRVALVSFTKPAPTQATYSLGPLTSAADFLSRVPPMSGGTDIGGGLSKGLEELEHSTEVRPSAVILVTDAKQNPDGTITPAQWDALRERVAKLRERRRDGVPQLVRGYVLSWGGGDTAPSFQAGSSCGASSSFTIAQCVFSPAETGAIVPANAAPFLASLPETFADRRFEALLAEDARAAAAGRAVTVQVTPGAVDMAARTAEVQVSADSATRHLPLRVCGLAARASGLTGLRVTSATPPCLDLPPGAKGVKTMVTLSWASGAQPWYALGPPPMSVGGTLSYRLTSTYSDLMSRAAGQDGRFAPAARPAAFTLAAPAGVVWQVELIVLAILLLLLLIRLAGFPTTLWVVRGEQRVRLHVWLPKMSHKVAGHAPLVIGTTWKPWRLVARRSPLEVLVWPLGEQKLKGPARARHEVDLRPYARRLTVSALPGITMSRGGWLRPGRPRKERSDG